MRDPASLEAQTVRGVAWTFLEQWGAQAAGLLLYVVLARLLTPSAFGLIAMAAVVVALLESTVSQGFTDAVVQRPELTPDTIDTAFWSTLGLGTAAAALAAAGAPLVARLFGAPELTPVIVAMAAMVPLHTAGATHRALLRRRMEFRPVTIAALGSTVAGGFAGVATALLGGGVWSLVCMNLVTAAVGSALLWLATDWRPRWRFSRARFAEMGRFAGSLVGANLVNFANRYADDIIVGAVLGPVALGFYNVAYRLLWAGSRLISGFAAAVALPALSRLQADLPRFRSAFYGGAGMAALVAAPAFTAVAVLAPELTVVLFGEQWLAAAPVLRVLAAIGILHAVFFINPAALTAAGRPDWVLKINLINATLNVVIFALVVRWGIVAVAVGYVVRGYLTAPVPLLALRSIAGVDLALYLRRLMPALAVAATVLAGLLLFRELGPAGALARVAGGVLGGTALFLLAVRTFDRAGLARIRSAVDVIRGRPPATAPETGP